MLQKEPANANATKIGLSTSAVTEASKVQIRTWAVMLLRGFSAHSLSRIKIEWTATHKTQAHKYISACFHFSENCRVDGGNYSMPSLKTSGYAHV